MYGFASKMLHDLCYVNVKVCILAPESLPEMHSYRLPKRPTQCFNHVAKSCQRNALAKCLLLANVCHQAQSASCTLTGKVSLQFAHLLKVDGGIHCYCLLPHTVQV